MDWRSKLTKKEKAHLREFGIRTKYNLAQAVKHQEDLRMRNTPEMPCRSRCRDYWQIARKVGVVVGNAIQEVK